MNLVLEQKPEFKIYASQFSTYVFQLEHRTKQQVQEKNQQKNNPDHELFLVRLKEHTCKNIKCTNLSFKRK